MHSHALHPTKSCAEHCAMLMRNCEIADRMHRCKDVNRPYNTFLSTYWYVGNINRASILIRKNYKNWRTPSRVPVDSCSLSLCARRRIITTKLSLANDAGEQRN